MHNKKIAAAFLLFILFVLNNCQPAHHPPTIVDGILDLSPWDFGTDGIIDLKGEAKYTELTGSNSLLFNPAANPGSWLSTTLPGKFPGNNKEGCFWYVIFIKLDNRQKDLGIYLKYVYSAYELYADGELLLKNGKPGISARDTTAQLRPTFEHLPHSGNDYLRLDWIISNSGSGYPGGPSNPIKIGTYATIRNHFQLRFLYNIIALAIVGVTGIYYLYFWILRRKDKRFLYIAICSLCIALRLFAKNLFLSEFFPHPDLFLTQIRLEFLSTLFAGLFVILYLEEIFNIGIHTKKTILNYFFRGFLVIIAAYSVFLFLVSHKMISVTTNFVNGTFIIAGLFFIIKFIRLKKRKQTEAVIFLLASSALVLCAAMDILIAALVGQNILPGTPDFNFAQLGFLLFIFIQAISLSTTLARTYRTNEHLRENLQLEVNKKTHQLEEANKELKEKDRYKTEFYQNITHELRTPLGLILGPVERLIGGAYGQLSTKIKEQLRMSTRNVHNLKILIDELLDLSKLEAGKMKVNAEKTDFITLLRQCTAHFESLFIKKNITFKLKCNVTELWISLDPEMINKVIRNLLSNAIKFTDAQGEITVVCRVLYDQTPDTHEQPGTNPTGYLELKVKDTGCGIPLEKQSGIFNRFVQADASLSRKYGGTGIGLAIVKEYTELHNGSVEVRSTPGQGSEFTIRLPIDKTYAGKYGQKLITLQHFENKVQPTEESPGLHHDLIPGTEQSNKILVVDDNPDIRSNIKEMLYRDYQVTVAGNGIEALALLSKEKPDLIISDLMMPDMDGHEFFTYLKADERFALIPVIIITAGEYSFTENKILLEADEFLSKPFTQNELLIRIKHLLSSRQTLFITGKMKSIKDPPHITPFPDQTELYPRQPILIVDDNQEILDNYRETFTYFGYSNLLLCQDSREAIPLLKKHPVSLVILDLSMPHLSGEEILSQIKENYPGLEVLVITALNSMQTAIDCLKQGAYDYMVKPIEIHKLLISIRHIIETHSLRDGLKNLASHGLSGKLNQPKAFTGIITRAESMFNIFNYIECIAEYPFPVLITGESGSGKEALPEVIHRLSKRQGKFISINLAGLDNTMFSDTLFGHMKGAYTGALRNRKGLIEQGNGGTLFLDEFGDLSLNSQIKLLRFLDNQEYRPLGTDTPKRADTRIIAATNANMEDKIKQGTFREDLFHRFTYRIQLPPLRMRKEDIPLLVDHFFAEISKAHNIKIPAIPPQLYTLLKTYHFPGNIRELIMMIENAISQHRGKALSLQYFRKYIQKGGGESKVPAEPESFTSFIKQITQLPSVTGMEEILIREALRRSDGNQSIAASLIGMPPSTLNRKWKDYNV